MAIRLSRAVAALVPRDTNSRLKKTASWLEGSGLFDAEFYLNTYPDVARAGVDPFGHFVANGLAERRDPNPWFDTDYYLSRYADVAESGVSPLRHFAEHGWREFRQPSPGFDMRVYFMQHVATQPNPINPLSHYLRQGRAAGLAIASEEDLGAGDLRRMSAVAEAILAEKATGKAAVERLKLVGNACMAAGLWRTADAVYREVVSQEGEVATNHWALATCHVQQQKWWHAEQSMSRAVKLDGKRPEWFMELADVHERMSHFDKAEDAIRKALGLVPHDPLMHYRLGYALEKCGKKRESRAAYSAAIDLSDDAAASNFGVGIFHEQRKLWAEAQAEYKRKLKTNPLVGGLHYRLGFTHERLWDWVQAEECYITGIALAAVKGSPNWHYRLGYVRERQGSYAEAASAYAAAIGLSEKPPRFWRYRLGYCLALAGDHAQACAAYSQMWPDMAVLESPHLRDNSSTSAGPRSHLETGGFVADGYYSQFDRREVVVRAFGADKTAANRHLKVGKACLWAGDFDGAIEAYQAALLRAEEYDPTWYFMLGQALAKKGRLADACDAFRQTRILQRAHGISEAAMRNDEAFAEKAAYLEYRECNALCENVIVYESFSGNSFTCTPLGIFRALLDDPEYRNYVHVVVLNDKTRIPEELRSRDNVVFIEKYSDGYLRHIATAKYLINNSGFPGYFIRREGQKYLNSWHGTPLKTLGKEQRYKFYDHKRTQRNFLQASHLITPNPHTTRITLDSYDIRQLATAKVAETGYPRIDLTLNADDARKAYLRERLGLHDQKPVVLYAPTWRGTPDDAQFDTTQLEHDLARLAEQDCHILFRGHNFLEDVINGDELDCAVVPGDIDTNELLSIVDVLITDYSSVFFDFFPTGRPILYYIYDQVEYERDRGLYFSMDEMPGYKCRDIDELADALATAMANGVANSDAHEEACRKYNLHDDGEAARRVIDFFFNDSNEHAIDYQAQDRASVILEGGIFEPGDLTDCFVALVGNMDREAVDVVVVFAPYQIEDIPENVEQFRRLPDDIWAVPRYGKFPLSLEERFLKRLQEAGQPIAEAGLEILRNAHTREFQRTFGFKRHDTVTCYAGYDASIASILIGNDLPMHKIIYLHGDMNKQFREQNPDLEQVFRLYGMADALVSLPGNLTELNKSNLSKSYSIDESRFVEGHEPAVLAGHE